ncbi:MAG: shikimate dehydrogenase [Bacteroidota bacterium]
MTKDRFNLDTKIVGLIGHPIRHTYSPLMHNISFDLAGLNYVYLPFDVPISNLKSAVKGMMSLGIKGFNVTIPHKENIIQLLHNISDEASIVGAVNTIVNENGRLSGYNTDVHGITETLSPYRDEISGSEISVIGSGGAARSVIYSLIRHFKPSKINLINRTEQKAESLKEYFSAKMHFTNMKSYELFPPALVEVFRNSHLIVNTTPVGMSPNTDDTITTLEQSFMSGQIVFDIIYNPVRTKLLELAASQGAVTLDGLKMFVHQGAKSYELWTGQEMPVNKILKALKLYISAGT